MEYNPRSESIYTGADSTKFRKWFIRRRSYLNDPPSEYIPDGESIEFLFHLTPSLLQTTPDNALEEPGELITVVTSAAIWFLFHKAGKDKTHRVGFEKIKKVQLIDGKERSSRWYKVKKLLAGSAKTRVTGQINIVTDDIEFQFEPRIGPIDQRYPSYSDLVDLVSHMDSKTDNRVDLDLPSCYTTEVENRRLATTLADEVQGPAKIKKLHRAISRGLSSNIKLSFSCTPRWCSKFEGRNEPSFETVPTHDPSTVDFPPYTGLLTDNELALNAQSSTIPAIESETVTKEDEHGEEYEEEVSTVFTVESDLPLDSIQEIRQRGGKTVWIKTSDGRFRVTVSNSNELVDQWLSVHPSMAAYAVVRCPMCGRQRPYPVSVEKYETGQETDRLKRGIKRHLTATHDINATDREHLTEHIVSYANIRHLSEDLLTDGNTDNGKWSEYDL